MSTVRSVRGRAEAIAAALERSLGQGAGIELLERRPLAYRSTFPVEELCVRFADGRARRLVLKDLGAGRGRRRRVKPAFLFDPKREVAAYRDILAPGELSAPAYLGAEVDPAAGRTWLFLELVDGEPLWQSGEPADWQRAAQWLAALHARFAGRVQHLPDCLLRYDADYYRRWLARARRFERRRRAGSSRLRRLKTLRAAYARALAWLSDQPATLLHGEFYPSNILIERSRGQAWIRPLDWEMAGVGPGVLDLAALVSGRWSARERTALVEAYRSSLPEALRPPAERLLAGLDRCRLLLAVQWLGWSRSWSPPPEHACDWLALARELAQASE